MQTDDPNQPPRIGADGAPEPFGGNETASDPKVTDDTPVVEAAQLFGRHRQVVIGHNGSRYVLRITKHGKLILNK